MLTGNSMVWNPQVEQSSVTSDARWPDHYVTMHTTIPSAPNHPRLPPRLNTTAIRALDSKECKVIAILGVLPRPVYKYMHVDEFLGVYFPRSESVNGYPSYSMRGGIKMDRGQSGLIGIILYRHVRHSWVLGLSNLMNEERGIVLILRTAPFMSLAHPLRSAMLFGAEQVSGSRRQMTLAPDLEILVDDEYFKRLNSVPYRVTFLRPPYLPLKTVRSSDNEEYDPGLYAATEVFGFGVYFKSGMKNGYHLFQKEDDPDVMMYHEGSRWIVGKRKAGSWWGGNFYFCHDSSLDPTRLYSPQHWDADMDIAVKRSVLEKVIMMTEETTVDGRKKQGFMLVEAPNEKKHVYDYIFDARWAAYLVATETPPDREELAEVKQDEYEEDFIIEIPGMFCVDSSSSLSYRMTREMGGTSGRSFRFSQRPVPPNATTRHG